MASYLIEKHGFASARLLAASVIGDMIANGFTKIFPTGAFNAETPPAAPFTVTLEASGTVDPLNDVSTVNKQPWRICFDVRSDELVGVYLGTPLQLPADGTYAFAKNAAGAKTDIIGSVGDVAANGTILATTLSQGWINRVTRIGTDGAAYPLSYRLLISPRGFWVGSWEAAETTETATNFNWILVQRPVDRDTGTVVTSGKAPVFCINKTNTSYWQFVVRESDILRPGKRRAADSNTEDSEGTLNTKNQVSLSEDGKYIVTFPSRLNTSRYRYPYELDLIATTSADVVSQFTDVPLSVYGEGSARTYTAMQSSGSSNTGMRLLVLKQGGGVA
jgi:hypothetical protein